MPEQPHPGYQPAILVARYGRSYRARAVRPFYRSKHARELVDSGKSPTEVAGLLGVSRATAYRALQRAAA